MQTSTYTRHREIRVGHIMTPWDKLLAVAWESIQSARAGDLLRVLEDAGITHLLVIEDARNNTLPIVRALVSRARLTRQLRAGLRRAV